MTSTPAIAAAPVRKRFHPSPVYVCVSADGTIADVGEGARRLLEYEENDVLDPCFFTHVHQRNLYQVMRDVAEMVTLGKPRASWIVRLRTGRHRWTWVRATVQNRLHDALHVIRIDLSPIQTAVA